MRKLSVLPAVIAALAIVAAACGGGGGGKSQSGGVVPVAGNSELAVGPNRFAVGLIDQTNRPVLGTSGTTVHLRFALSGQTKVEQDATFVWAIQDVNGFWTADINFDTPGQWSLDTVLTRDGKQVDAQALPLLVVAKSAYPNVGDKPPPSENLTLTAQSNIKRISTDPAPEPALYQTTVAQALQAGKPFVVTFATPAYCQTRFCGPMVDNVKSVRQQFADRVTFIHIEPYVLNDQGQLVQAAAGGPEVSQPMQQWNLQTEPWVFVIGADGRISTRFEGAASADELKAAIQKVLP